MWLYNDMHCSSKWRHPDIVSHQLDHLTLTSVHPDIRYHWKTTPSMKADGLHYPLLCWEEEESFWSKFVRITNEEYLKMLPPPNPVDGKLILVKGGNNRLQSARELGYTSIDCLVFKEQRDAIVWTRYLQQCDPLVNPDLPFLGLVDYK